MAKLTSHPKGLFILAACEMWERTSFYGLVAILLLFLTAGTDAGGLGLSNTDGLTIVGLFSMMVYVLGIPGGLIADRWLGQKKTVLLGGIILIFGHGIMALTSAWAIYTGLVVISIGVGLLKPNISTMVAELYPKNEPQKLDSGFTLFYMAINMGSLIGSLAVGYLASSWGWHYGFAFAGFGMIAGVAILRMGRNHLEGIGEKPTQAFLQTEPIFPIKMREYKPLTLIAIALIAVLVFWGGFEQAKGFMTLYTEHRTRKLGIPTAMFAALNPAFILIFGGLMAWIWSKTKGLWSFPLFKMGLGTVIMGLGFVFMIAATDEYQEIGSSAIYWLVGAYLFHTLGELCLSPVALSYITQTAPKRMVSSAMGIYFAVTGFGGMLAAEVGKFSESLGEMNTFIGLTVFPIAIGGMLMLLSPLLLRWQKRRTVAAIAV